MADLGSISTIDVLGWAAAGVFTTSYLFTRPRTLRRVQMLGAAMWLAYGVFLRANPVVVANLLNIAALVWTTRRSQTRPAAAPGNAPDRSAPVGDAVAGREPVGALPEV